MMIMSGASLHDYCPYNLISSKIGLLLSEKGKQKLSLLPWLVLRYIPKRDVFAHGSLDPSIFSLCDPRQSSVYTAQWLGRRTMQMEGEEANWLIASTYGS
jgi:hypothetical protein